MELREIRTFVAVAQYGSFSRAAAHLGYSQAAVTIQMKQLEQKLGVVLFDRIGKGVHLTTSGQRFYPHAIRILNDLSLAQEDLQAESQLTGSLKIGTIDSLCAAVLPQLLERYHSRCPLVRLSVVTDTPQLLLDMLQSNALDVVYLSDELLTDPRFFKVLEVQEPVVFAAAKGFALADGRPHKLEELLTHPFILTEKDASYRRVLDYTLQLHSRSIEPVLQCNDTDLVLKMVRRRMGITFLPRYALREEAARGSIEEIEVEDLSISIWQQLIYHKDKWVSREMRQLFELLRPESAAQV